MPQPGQSDIIAGADTSLADVPAPLDASAATDLSGTPDPLDSNVSTDAPGFLPGTIVGGEDSPQQSTSQDGGFLGFVEGLVTNIVASELSSLSVGVFDLLSGEEIRVPRPLRKGHSNLIHNPPPIEPSS